MVGWAHGEGRTSHSAPTGAIELAPRARASRDRAADPARRTRHWPTHQRKRPCVAIRDEPRSHTGGATSPRGVRLVRAEKNRGGFVRGVLVGRTARIYR